MLETAIAISFAMIALLWRSDPKRRRIAGLAAGGDSIAIRWLMVVATLLPGAALAAIGDASGFLIWFGSCAIAGWLIAHLRSRNAVK